MFFHTAGHHGFVIAQLDGLCAVYDGFEAKRILC